MRIREARYNSRYKDIDLGIGKPSYLREKNMDNILVEEIRALIRIRCGNMEKNNKFWLEKDNKVCVFCRTGKDNIKHYIEKCEDVKEWFNVLGDDNKEKYRKIWNDELD